MPETTVYELDLLENGLDFVTSGIEIYFGQKTPRPRSHKYAILHVFSGMLLLLKERLARIRPSLVFVPEADYGKPRAKTTNYHQTFLRLEEHGITIDPVRRRVLDRIQELRNAIEHYRVNLSLAESREVIGEMISFVHGFCLDELDIHIDDRLSDKTRDHFYELKGVGDNMYKFMEKDFWAEVEAEEKYFRELYAGMAPDELLRCAAADEAIDVEDVPLARCPACNKIMLVYLSEKSFSTFEFGVCTNPGCRAVIPTRDLPTDIFSPVEDPE